MSAPTPALAPDRETDGALSRLVDVLLDKGVHLDLDLLITVAEVPLIAVRLRAMIAGVETMLEHGIPGVWSDSVPGPRSAPPPHDRTPVDEVLVDAPARRREARDGGDVWRDGVLELDARGVLRWRGGGDRHPSMTLDATLIETASLESPAVGPPVLVLHASSRTERLALAEATRWAALLGGDARPPRGGPA